MWNSYLDLYCERLGPGVFEEPFNFLSNFAFILSFIFLVRLTIKHKINFIFYFFTFMVLIIGLGSFSFHALANKVGFLLDIIPIFTFVTVYFAWANRFILKVPSTLNSILVLSFLGVTYFLEVSPLKSYASGSISYVPTLCILLFYSFYPKVPQDFRNKFLMASILFFVALGFRSSDLYFCNYVGWGSHFLWHILNARILYTLCVVSSYHPSRT